MFRNSTNLVGGFKYFLEFFPLGKICSNLTGSYFSDGLVKNHQLVIYTNLPTNHSSKWVDEVSTQVDGLSYHLDLVVKDGRNTWRIQTGSTGVGFYQRFVVFFTLNRMEMIIIPLFGRIFLNGLNAWITHLLGKWTIRQVCCPQTLDTKLVACGSFLLKTQKNISWVVVKTQVVFIVSRTKFSKHVKDHDLFSWIWVISPT